MLVIRLVYSWSLARNESPGCQRLGLSRATTLSFEEGVIGGWEAGLVVIGGCQGDLVRAIERMISAPP